MDLLSTGSSHLDQFLHGGIRTGMITNILGESGAGKSQFCFTICANLLKKNKNVNIIFIDTSGTFRPERIFEIIEYHYSDKILNNIKYFRPYSIKHQFEAIKKISQIKPKLVIIDTITSIISLESKNISRHLILMKFIHELAHLAINNNCAIVTTNMVRNIFYSNKNNNNTTNNKSINQKIENQKEIKLQREFMEKSVALSVHIKLKFEILSITNNIYKASFLQPLINDSILFRITKKGVI
ncbi:MAG TPA: ATPase domain-containing protein [Nitrososphaeraceae archaeon]|nr:ATPase domain-containing protein [Nitrososphaeraceae archaeon]